MSTLSPAAPAPSSPASPSASRRSFTRDEILSLGQSGDPFEFISLAHQALVQLPGDAPLRFLLATAYARLLLRTPASEQLRLLPQPFAADPGVQSLSSILPQLPNDTLSLADLTRTLTQNLDALASRADSFRVDLRPHLPKWSAWAARHSFHAARSFSPSGTGNVFIRPLAEPTLNSPFPWITWFGDARAAADTLSLPIEPPTRFTPPLLIEGIQPPWLFQRLYANTPNHAAGYRVPIRLVQADINEFFTGLAFADLRAELADTRVQPFIGPDASNRLATYLGERLQYHILNAGFRTPGLTVPAVPAVTEVLGNTQSAQRRCDQDLRARVNEIYSSRTPAWYAKRFAEVRSGTSAEPLRILVPTCRYSTFIQHSAHDIAAAFRAIGCEAQVLIEPDDHLHFLPAAYLQAIADFKPDAVLVINYTRYNLPKTAVPDGVPFICWVQDAMPHLFDAAVGRAQTPLDFMAGHIHEELALKYDYPKHNAMSLPVMASASKFHAGPVDAALRQRLECELAFVTHHSPTPEELHAQIIRTGQTDEPTRRLFDTLFPAIRAHVDRSGTTLLHSALRAEALNQTRAAFGDNPAPQLLTRIVNNYVFPIADRMIRHDAIRWGAEICQRRNWRFKLHGRGWDTHPQYRPFAAGELAHGEELRASYQSAACHIHASIHWAYHQRVLECALSGGLPIYRLKADDLAFLSSFTRQALIDDGTPSRPDPDVVGGVLFDSVDHPESLARLALLQRLGFPGGHIATLACGVPFSEVSRGWQGLPMSHDVAWFLGDHSEVGFRSSADLELAIEKAVTMPRWREQLSRGIARRTQANFTYDIAAQNILGKVTDSLVAISST